MKGAPFFAARPKPGGSPGPSPVPVSECTGKVLLSDDFKQVDSSWGVSAEVVSVEEGKLKVKAKPGGHAGFVYPDRLFKDADYCVTIQSPNNLKEQRDGSLLAFFIFWVRQEAGETTLYALMVGPNGRAALGRGEKRQLLEVVGFRDVPGMNKGAGAKNAVRVSTTGDSITAYVNGRKFASVRAQAPEEGGMIGFWAQSEKASRDTWKFLNLKVTERAN
jgi:hypothetical protein